ncbi:MAG TPA: XTP/dITP diphosphatase [Rhabdochlamydiaceae bacterium]|nr:XTP/dITP diphosphatase [Rhabdochlamydiaceae bacterium]HSX13092.1 XTP/dITP diphosphatase [Chlamydiales bacterium]
MEIVIASKNVHKMREIRAILKNVSNLDLFSLLDFPHYHPAPEVGTTFEENAVQKAQHAAHALQRWVLADDSGLVVPALSGAPGVYSARYAGEGATDKDNRHKLLREMNHLSDPNRQAYFECCLALASPEGLKKCVKGTCEGTITTEERGNRGFGYDPIFIKYEYSKTFAELEEDIKNRISHRRKALDKLLLTLNV